MILTIFFSLLKFQNHEPNFVYLIDKVSGQIDETNYEKNITVLFGFYLLLLNEKDFESEDFNKLLESPVYDEFEKKETPQRLYDLSYMTIKRVLYIAGILPNNIKFEHGTYMKNIRNAYKYFKNSFEYQNKLLEDLVDKVASDFLNNIDFNRNSNYFLSAYFNYIVKKCSRRDDLSTNLLINLDLFSKFSTQDSKNKKEIMRKTYLNFKEGSFADFEKVFKNLITNTKNFYTDKKEPDLDDLKILYDEMNNLNEKIKKHEELSHKDEHVSKKGIPSNPRESNVEERLKQTFPSTENVSEEEGNAYFLQILRIKLRKTLSNDTLKIFKDINFHTEELKRVSTKNNKNDLNINALKTSKNKEGKEQIENEEQSGEEAVNEEVE